MADPSSYSQKTLSQFLMVVNLDAFIEGKLDGLWPYPNRPFSSSKQLSRAGDFILSFVLTFFKACPPPPKLAHHFSFAQGTSSKA
jgi:hypothetical protein